MMSMATEPAIGTRIKRARERKRWTQRQLADKIGVSQKTVDNWENGRTEPRSSIGALEEVLGVSLDGTPPPPAVPQSLLKAIADDEELTDEQKVAVIAAVDETLARERGERASSASRGAPARHRPAS